jgi:hypothetical protein
MGARPDLAAARTTPPRESGLSHWSSRELAAFLRRTEGVEVSHNYVAKLWRETGLRPHRQGTFKVSRDPGLVEKVADVVGLYREPPGGAVVLSVDEKTQAQALDRTQPVLPIAFDVSEQRTHDYVWHGTTNSFAALNVGTGEVYGEWKPTRSGTDFLAFLKAAVKPQAGKDVHVVLDNLSTHNHSRGSGLAGQPSSGDVPLHANRLVLDQSDRNLVWHHYPPGHPAGDVCASKGVGRPHP